MSSISTSLIFSFLSCLFQTVSANTDLGPSLGGGLGGLVVLILDIIAIIDVVRSGANSTTKLLWIIVILLFPIIGVILWLCIGRRGSAGGV